MKLWWIGGSVALLLGAAGCGQRVSQTLPPAQAPAQTIAVSPPPQPAAALPTVAVPASPQPLPVPNLIPPTAPNDRVAIVPTGRTDPFTAVASIPVVITRPSVAVAASIAPRPVAPAQSPAPSPIAVRPSPVSVPLAATPNSSPAAPTPTIAQSIAISGVVQTGDRTSAIVQVPQEGSRYVRAGDRIASGRVLVKRIEVGTNADPVVILEQDGVEVIRTVGSSSGLL